jgi:transcription antitermination factor NusG
LRSFFSPLFTGYVFCVATPPLASTLRQNRYVANLLAVVDQAQLIQQLRQIRLALDAGDELEVLPYLEVGKPVRVSQGPLKGLEGVISRIKGKTRIVINVDMIRESVAVEVDGSFLDPA